MVIRQSIGPIIDAIRARVESLTPRTYPEITFSAPRGNLGSANAEDWIEDQMRATRDFVVFTSGLPNYTDSGAPCHISQEITIAIVYRSELADDVRDIVISEDVEQIRDAVTQRPEFWGGADSVYSSSASNVATFEDMEGQKQVFVVTIPLVVVTH